MVSSLRQRATRLATEPARAGQRSDPQWVDAVEAAAAPSVSDIERPVSPPRMRTGTVDAARRRMRWPAWLDFRRFGLGVSIVAAMVASAIGGGLLAVRQATPASASAAVAPPATPAQAMRGGAPPVDLGQPAVATETTALRSVAGTSAAAESRAHAPAPLPAATPSAVDTARGRGDPMPASPLAGHAAADAAAPPAPPLSPAVDVTFGLDVNGDGIPDALERFVRKTIAAPATRVAARRYYRVALPLAAVAQQGEALTLVDQKAVFRAAECYLLSAAEDGQADPPNLNDRASLAGAAAARRIQALAEALRGFDYRVSDGKRQSCA